MRTPTLIGLAAVLALGLTVPTEAAERPRATVRSTEDGIPHVLAGDFESLGYGQGYAAARDNLCVIADGMLTLGGERSRHFGPDTAPTTIVTSARTSLVSDSYFTAINDSKPIERELAKPAPRGPKREVRDKLTIPGRYNVAGALFVGTPFVSLGHNETQAWGAARSPTPSATSRCSS